MVGQRAQRKQESRRRLLEAAARHFATRGFEAAAVDRIAAEAGVAKGSVYNHFASKDDLFGAVLAEACRRAVRLAGPAPPPRGWRAGLLELARADVEVFRENRDFYRVLFREVLAARPETYAAVLRHLHPFLERVRELLELGQQGGEVRTDLGTDRLARLFAGLLALLYLQHWGSGGDWPSLEELPHLAVTLFADGAAAAPGATASPSRDGQGGSPAPGVVGSEGGPG